MRIQPNFNPFRPRWGLILATTVALALAGDLCWTVSLMGWLLPLAVVVYLVGVALGAAPGVWSLWISLSVLIAVGSVLGVDSISSSLVVDSLNSPFLFLTASLFPVIILASLESIHKNQFWYYLMLLILLVGLLFCFSSTSFLGFYLVFEVLGFPMFILIGLYGPRPQRVRAAYKFFVYTFISSAVMLPVLVYLVYWVGSTSVVDLVRYEFTQEEQVLFFGMASVPFLIKVPLIPFHLWLPEAHVEAPTPISMLLAGLLLKTGGYAFLRFLLPVFPHGGYLWGPFLMALGVVSVLLSSVYAVVQIDLKRMVAYASIAHMSVVLVGLLSNNVVALQGATYLMLAHGYTSAGLFAGIGILYDRYHTRTIRYYGGLNQVMPLFGFFFFLLSLSNISFPLTGGFIGEFLLLLGISQHNLVVVFLLGSTVVLSLVYSMWLYNRLFYGPMGMFTRFEEITQLERTVLGYLTFFSVGLGLVGAWFVEYTHPCYLLVVNTAILG